MNNLLKSVKKPLWTLFLGLGLWACQDASETLTSEQAVVQSTTTVRDHAIIVAETQGAMEITADIFDNEGFTDGRASSSGRIEGGDHHHHDDAGCRPSISGSFNLDRSHEDSLIYTGTLVIDYGDGENCDSEHVRKGKITDAFTFILTWGDSVTFTSTETITFEGFVRDSVQLDGTFTVTKVNRESKKVEIQDAKITYPDGTSVSWSGELNFTYERGEGCRWKDNTIHLSGSISGTNRDGVAFSFVTTEDLVFKYGCNKHHKFRPVSGVVEVTIGGILTTVDFGDGTCDNSFTVTTNGETTEHEFDGHS
ncbi:MAG: hypothetical protein HC859_14435 [Bacteroidia bacterium]|nr:hypothetical protein [Bacteroidia bacterium]